MGAVCAPSAWMRKIPPRLRLALVTTVVLAAHAPGSAQSVERQMIVSVLDGDGRPVVGLTPSDFLIREDGAPREVLRVAPASTGRQIALLVDTSSAADPVVGDIRRGVEAFVTAMADGNEIALIAFGGIPRILTDATSDVSALRDGIGRIFAYSQAASYLLDAVRETAQGFERRDAERPVMVVMTTMGLDYSNRDAQSVVDLLEETGTAFYAVVFAEGAQSLGPTGIGGRDGVDLQEGQLQRDRLLDLGAERTGGRRRELQSGSAAERALQDLAADLRGQYLIDYARPDALIPPERIEVESTRDDLDARGTPLVGDQ